MRIEYESDQYLVERDFDDVTGSFDDSYTYTSTPYATEGRTWMWASVYFLEIFVGVVELEAQVYVP